VAHFKQLAGEDLLWKLGFIFIPKSKDGISAVVVRRDI
jgi:hypothetical protein